MEQFLFAAVVGLVAGVMFIAGRVEQLSRDVKALKEAVAEKSNITVGGVAVPSSGFYIGADGKPSIIQKL